ncbi:MAG TPA: SigB/SigF/SigG family RNA polymerase sigma factor [Armatimonadetes bacterium]|nr:SigB/SigF/SigG family RNA polymerase sigma factor [Armatimonadota bacterium]
MAQGKRREQPAPWHDVEELFRQYKATRDPKIREQIILKHSDLVHALARRFKDRGEPFEDLVQVAWIGLVKAVDRYDPDRGNRFTSFAVPTILGELRRYFRDRGWTMHVPRRLQELNQKARRAVEELSVKLGRPPTIAEIADAIDATEEDTIEALEIARAYDLESLDREAMPVDEDAEPQSLLDMVAADDEAEWERVTLRHELEMAMRVLDERERKIIEMSFFEDLPQTAIARELGISQMHVSRLLHRALNKLRQYMSEKA